MNTGTASEPVNDREILDAELKTRVPKEVKQALEQVAANRHLRIADIAREAFREYLARNNPNQLELAAALKQSEAAR